MSLRRVSAIAALVLSLGGAVAFISPNSLIPEVFAQNTESPERPMRGKTDRLVQELNLTPEQTQQIEAIQAQYQEEMSQSKEAMRQAQQELMDLMAGTASVDQIREQYNQVETLKQQVSQLRFDSMLAMREVLTPEQRSQAAQLMQNRRGGHHGNRPMNRGESREQSI